MKELPVKDIASMRAIRIHRTGGPEVLEFDSLPIPVPPPGHALVRIAAAGVNFIDVYKRTGLYKLPLPAILGEEGAGRIVSFGAGARVRAVCRRVAWAVLVCAFSACAVVSVERLASLPDG